MSHDDTMVQPAGYNTPIPEKILTPDTVETRLGTLRFYDGQPLPETVELIYDYLDLSRGAETFLNGMPAASMEALRRGLAELGVTGCNDVLIFDDLMDSNPLFLTGNTDTVYVMNFLDTKKDGPIVVEVPAGSGPGFVNSAFFRFVIDMGAPGPDAGNGGKYLICPPEYDPVEYPIGGKLVDVEVGCRTEKMWAVRSPTYVNWLALRGFLVDGKPDESSRKFRRRLKIYPLSQAGAPPKMNFVNGSREVVNTIHANNAEFYEELKYVIDREPIGMIEPELRGLFSSIGIEKGKPFEPDARMKEILTQAVAVGNATARAVWIRSRHDETYFYPNSAWYTGFVGGSHEFLKDDGLGGRNLDARILFHYMATGITPAMCNPRVGVGSQYALASVDKNGHYFDGSATYKITLPAGVPAEDFWSLVVYDPQTRSQLQTGQPFPSVNNLRGDLRENDDGSIDVYFAPEAPEGWESNWVQTIAGKSWFVCLRLYGPKQEWFDKTWRPGELERVRAAATEPHDPGHGTGRPDRPRLERGRQQAD